MASQSTTKTQLSDKVLSQMRDFAERRAERYSPLLLNKFFPLTQLTSLTWIGSFSWTNNELAKRFIDKSVVIDTLFDIPQTPPEVGRDYLRSKYTERRRHTMNQYTEINKPRSAPRYVWPGTYSDMAYVDLKSAYWSVIQIVGWDVDYHPGRWLGKRSENTDFPLPDNKLARNSLVSAGLLHPTHVWTGSAIKGFKVHNPLVNYDLWACVNDVLHALASKALEWGAVYINTDGYIIPAKLAPFLQEEIESWGLRAGIKAQGDATVYAVGSYSIGDFATKHKPHWRSLPLDGVYRPDADWLKPRIAKLARTAIRWER